MYNLKWMIQAAHHTNKTGSAQPVREMQPFTPNPAIGASQSQTNILTPQSRRTKNSEKRREEVQIVLDLLLTFSDEKIEACLERTDFETYLFTTEVTTAPDEPELSLFQHIISSAERTKIFTNCIKDTLELGKKIANHLMIRHIQEYERKGTLDAAIKDRLLRTLLVCNLDLVKNKYVIKWLKASLCQEHAVVTSKTLLYWLTLRHPEVLITLLEKHPNIIASIPAADWGMTLENAYDKEASPLCFLLDRNNEGLRFMQKLLEKLPGVIATIPSSAWRFMTRRDSLGHLIQGSEGLKFLDKLLDDMPDVFSAAMPAEAWLVEEGFGLSRCSSLTILTKTPQRLQLLLKLFQKCPNLIAAIPTEAWVKEANNGCSPLHWLSSSTIGLSILHKLFDEMPRIFAAIPAEAWGKALSAKAGPSANISPLYYLTAIPLGHKLLEKMLDTMPQVIAGIPIEAWGRALGPEAGSAENASPVYSLSAHHEGLVTLKKMLEIMPEVIAAIPAAAWVTPFPRDGNLTPLQKLAATIDGHKILKELEVVLAPQSGILAEIKKLTDDILERQAEFSVQGLVSQGLFQPSKETRTVIDEPGMGNKP